MCSGGGMLAPDEEGARSPPPTGFCRFLRRLGEGEGDMRTRSARVLGGVSLLWAWPWPPRLPWCFFAPLAEAALPSVGKASASSTAGTEGVGAREVCRLEGRECGLLGPLGICEMRGLKPGGGATAPMEPLCFSKASQS